MQNTYRSRAGRVRAAVRIDPLVEETINGMRLAKITGACGRLLFSLLALFILVQVVVTPGVAWAQTTSAERESTGDTTVIGATEQVILVNEENGEEVETLGRIDTGAFYTSIGQDLADDIGIDTENAETITARSALGEQTRTGSSGPTGYQNGLLPLRAPFGDDAPAH